MLEKLDEKNWILVGQIVCNIVGKKNGSLLKYYIFKIIDKSQNVNKSLEKIDDIISDCTISEEQIVCRLADLYEKENTKFLKSLCNCYYE